MMIMQYVYFIVYQITDYFWLRALVPLLIIKMCMFLTDIHLHIQQKSLKSSKGYIDDSVHMPIC